MSIWNRVARLNTGHSVKLELDFVSISMSNAIVGTYLYFKKIIPVILKNPNVVEYSVFLFVKSGGPNLEGIVCNEVKY